MSGASTPADLMTLIAGPQFAGPGRGQFKRAVNRVARRVSDVLLRMGKDAMKPSRVEDLWRAANEPRWWEMDALRTAAEEAMTARIEANEKRAAKEAKDELAEIDARLARLEALLVQDEEFVRPHADALSAMARRPHSPLDR